MDVAAISQYIIDAFEGVEVLTADDGTRFFFFNPGGDVPKDHRFPFITIVTSDAHDTASDLNRPDVFRLNIGVKKETYRAMFGDPPAFPASGGTIDTGHDFTALDQIMPHPIYAAMSWVCVLNPNDATFEKVRPLLAEAYEQIAMKKR